MIVDWEFKNSNLIVSYIDATGQIKLKYFPWTRPTKYITTSDLDNDKSGKYVRWDGKAIKQIYTKRPNKYSVFNLLDKLPEEDQKALFDYQEPNIFFIDIETEILDKKPQPHLANQQY